MEYRTEGLRLFKGMQSAMSEHLLRVLQGIGADAAVTPVATRFVLKPHGGHGNIGIGTPKVGRNDPCPCGSGKNTRNAMEYDIIYI